MSELIYQDAEGNEIKRVTKGRGRAPKGAQKQENGDWVLREGVGTATESRLIPQYIVLDERGNEIMARVSKGRGRPKPGFEKQSDGPYKGHWVKVVKENTETEAIVEAEVETVVDTPATETVSA